MAGDIFSSTFGPPPFKIKRGPCKDDDLVEEEQSASEFKIFYTSKFHAINNFISKGCNVEKGSQVLSTLSCSNSSYLIKLPKLEIRLFGGKLDHWSEFGTVLNARYMIMSPYPNS